jgi:hypothetical protein
MKLRSLIPMIALAIASITPAFAICDPEGSIYQRDCWSICYFWTPWTGGVWYPCGSNLTAAKPVKTAATAKVSNNFLPIEQSELDKLTTIPKDRVFDYQQTQAD